MVIVFSSFGIFTNTNIFGNRENLLADYITIRHNIVIFFLAGIRLTNNGDTILFAELVQLFLRIFTKLCPTIIIVGKEHTVNFVSIGIVFIVIQISVFAWEAIASKLGICISYTPVKVVLRHHSKIVKVIINQSLSEWIKYLNR